MERGRQEQLETLRCLLCMYLIQTCVDACTLHFTSLYALSLLVELTGSYMYNRKVSPQISRTKCLYSCSDDQFC